jgi:hypothetical protein
VQVLTFRALTAVVTTVTAKRHPVEAPDPVHHSAAIVAIFAQRPIVPVPPGVIFRRRDTLIAWLELHYAALRDALRYVDGRVEARVHVRCVPEHEGDNGSAATTSGPFRRADDVDGGTQSALEELGHSVVAWTMSGPRDARAASASFLVERSHWREFADMVAAEGQRQAGLDIQLTGPWPPYDFVRLQFGG